MISEDGEWILCAWRDCSRKIKNHRWAVKNSGEDWFFSRRTGHAWCPDHHPEWLAGWRERTRERNQGG